MAALGALVGLTYLQLVSGALVAGNDAGRGYTDWPLMNGHVLPPESFELGPLWRNFVETAALVQFNHRVLGYLLALGAIVGWLYARSTGYRSVGRWAAWAVLAIWLQMAWGIYTVTEGAPLWLAIAHQAGALATVAVMLRARFEAAYPADQSLRG